MAKIDLSRIHCLSCITYSKEKEAQAQGEMVCCKWFMDNVVCGTKQTTTTCPEYEKQN